MKTWGEKMYYLCTLNVYINLECTFKNDYKRLIGVLEMPIDPKLLAQNPRKHTFWL